MASLCCNTDKVVCTVCTVCTLCTVCILCTVYTVCIVCTVYTLFIVCTLCIVCTLYTLCILCTLYAVCTVYRVQQEERSRLREGVPYVKLYRKTPKHLYPTLNVLGDNGHWRLKLWQLLHTYWLPNSIETGRNVWFL